MRGSVLYGNATKDGPASQDQCFADRGTRRIGHLLPGFIGKSSKNALPLESDIPTIRNRDFNPAKDRFDQYNCFLSLDICATEVNFDATEDGGDHATTKIVDAYTALNTAEQCM